MTSDWTLHGGNLHRARQHFGGSNWIDLSTGINPRPWPGADHLTIDWHRLPEPADLAALEATAAGYFGCDPCHVCAVPGTEIGLRLVGQIIERENGLSARHVAPGYSTHSEVFCASRAIDSDALASCGGPLLLANPNNPDGHVTAPESLRALLNNRGPNEWLLIDEAFADCTPTISLTGSISEDHRLLIFRSFGKFFGLAGVRLGFVLGSVEFLARLRALLGAWPISAAAIAIGMAAYADGGWIAHSRNWLVQQSAAFDALLHDLRYAAIGDCPLFRLIECDDASALFTRIAQRAILTRPFSDQPRWLRLGLPADDSAMARLRTALTDG